MTTDEKDALFLVKHTAAIHMEADFSLQERKIFNILLKNSSRGRSFKDWHVIHIKDLACYLGLKNNSNYVNLKEQVLKLVRKSVRFNILNKDKKNKWEEEVNILSVVRYHRGVIYYQPSEYFLKICFNPSLYANLNISYQNALSSKHSLALWEYCCEQLDSKKTDCIITDYMPISKLRALLGVPEDKYLKFKDLNTKVLNKAIEEINQKTDIKIEASNQKKMGLKVEEIAFTVTRLQRNEEPPQQDLLNIDIIAAINESFDRQEITVLAEEIGLNSDGLHNYLKQYSDKEVKSALVHLKKKLEKGMKIHNIAGYLWKLLDQGLVEEIDAEENSRNNLKKRIYGVLQKFKDEPENVQKLINAFADQYGAEFANWFKDLEIVSYTDGIALLSTASSVVRDWVEYNLRSQIKACWKRVDPEFEDIQVILSADLDKPTPVAKPEPSFLEASSLEYKQAALEYIEKCAPNPRLQQVMSILKDQVGERPLVDWISHLNFAKETESEVWFEAGGLVKDFVEENYASYILEAWQELNPEINMIRIVRAN